MTFACLRLELHHPEVEGAETRSDAWRYDARAGKTPPAGFVAAQDPDAETGHWPGWVPVGDGPDDKWHRAAVHGHPALSDEPNGAALLAFVGAGFVEGATYELVGPRVQGNPEGLTRHEFWRHGCVVLTHVPLTFDGLREYLTHQRMEGIVWHHEDGRMAKIKRRDFGLPWPLKVTS